MRALVFCALFVAPVAGALTDYGNLDAGRPFRVEDALVTPFGSLDGPGLALATELLLPGHRAISPARGNRPPSRYAEVTTNVLRHPSRVKAMGGTIVP